MFLRSAIGLLLMICAVLSCAAAQPQPQPWTAVGQEIGVDWRILYAIALTESRMALKDDRITVPWPWTVNSPEGAMRFDSRAKALDHVRRLLQTGRRNIDVGLMQINLQYHAQRTNNDIGRLIEPKTNIKVAAEILKENLRDANGNLDRAVAMYHSRNPEAGEEYRQCVLRQFKQLLLQYPAGV